MRTCDVEMSDGKVACPFSATGAVDVEKCYRCPRLRAFYDEESGTRVVCAAPPRNLRDVFARMPHARA